MATKRSLILNSADQNSNKKQRAVTEVNPKVDRTVVAELGEKLNALTENTLVEATSLDKTNLDDALMEKRTPTLEFVDLPFTTQEAFDEFDGNPPEDGWYKIDINYDGDGQLYYPNYDEWPSGTYQANTETIIDEAVVAYYLPTSDESAKHFQEPICCKCVYVNGKWQLWVSILDDVNRKFIVKATETDTCNAVTATANLAEIE